MTRVRFPLDLHFRPCMISGATVIGIPSRDCGYGPKCKEQISRLINSTARMDGDLQGIAGGAIEEIEGFGLPLIEVAIAGPN